MVFARLVIRNAPQTIDFLHGLQLDDRSALAAVLSVWATNSEFFYGRHTNKVWYAVVSRVWDRRFCRVGARRLGRLGARRLGGMSLAAHARGPVDARGRACAPCTAGWR